MSTYLSAESLLYTEEVGKHVYTHILRHQTLSHTSRSLTTTHRSAGDVLENGLRMRPSTQQHLCPFVLHINDIASVSRSHVLAGLGISG